jgi:hypothetical protein
MPLHGLRCALSRGLFPRGRRLHGHRPIYQDKDLPEDQKIFISINRELAKIYRPVTSKSGPAPEAEKWRGVADKRKLLDLQDIDFDMPA